MTQQYRIGPEEKRQRQIEAKRRYRARKRGEDIPFQQRGVPKGYKQAPEHVEKRGVFNTGPAHPSWKGDSAGKAAGYVRARNLYRADVCSLCEASPAEIHHIDGNPLHNEPDNIQILCRQCHVDVENRGERISRALKRHYQQKAS